MGDTCRSTEIARRKVLETAVAALCVETGFTSVEKHVLGTLSEATQSFITELGRTGRMYSELSLRTEPTLLDVHSALIDAGFDVNSLPEYSKRPQRRHLPRQPRSYPQPQPKCLQVGSKVAHPPNIPQHLPSLPDPHTYIKTPTFNTPSSDYKTVREKLAAEKHSSRKALSTLLSKTRPSKPIAGSVDPTGLYTVVTNTPPPSPVYLQALLLVSEAKTDSTSTWEDESRHLEASQNSGHSLTDSQQSQETGSNVSLDDGCGVEGQSFLAESESNESYENPFLKSAKLVKLTVSTKPE